MNRLRCFIAMRFGETETDRVYNRLIEPTVKQLKIAPIRIDRVEHNDNIDQRIMRELEECDLAIRGTCPVTRLIRHNACFQEAERFLDTVEMR